ncbi:hypothetical protein EV1_027984 [Malus domestica]|uniref:mitogen-activated protein kinase kinase kinase 20-like n=1 Tax=Malus sylvestris TaxID=3752 RepID=UPI0021AD0293|nr:mitogen-activated protein kinase kinase kinase 20-like [Malus sylvestris]XP_050137688.1 mitogen-activated protein kinase kinase kinase 20-like [Malus sylvestris]XP_050137689.1 mitogen-activated protein kinase kinase kinase 20-like [Malus sylvestris]XP_050137690.1 mitogen-activated protein kinase kinase kinase 20-like [Malus sylvestris]XP_050137691.1 mitogen-activated protein kinase kinase kinase 20-like [Malus sylvestris]XP_050137692.1 mitogen-activated protein kinase kinase kinase 20-like 
MKRKDEEEELGRLWGDGEEWERGDLIGEGCFGSVFLAFSKKNKPIVSDRPPLPPVMAVKSAELSHSESIQHETEVLSYVKGSAFVIDCLGEEITTSEDGDQMVYNLLLEFAAGGTLDGLIRRFKGRGLPESDVISYTRSILRGLIHIHECDYVHCDLKPENILLVPVANTGRFVAKVADLGLAKRTKEDVGGWRGTPRYTDPDALMDNVQNQSSDIWSVGAIVLEMLTGSPPWDVKPGSDLEDFLDMVSQEITPKIPPGISSAANDFLKCCLAINSWERLTAEQLLFHPFIAEPQASEACHSSLGYTIVPKIQPPVGLVIPAGL